jgi:hypothetical protein
VIGSVSMTAERPTATTTRASVAGHADPDIADATAMTPVPTPMKATRSPGEGNPPAEALREAAARIACPDGQVHGSQGMKGWGLLTRPRDTSPGRCVGIGGRSPSGGDNSSRLPDRDLPVRARIHAGPAFGHLAMASEGRGMAATIASGALRVDVLKGNVGGPVGWTAPQPGGVAPAPRPRSPRELSLHRSVRGQPGDGRQGPPS